MKGSNCFKSTLCGVLGIVSLGIVGCNSMNDGFDNGYSRPRAEVTHPRSQANVISPRPTSARVVTHNEREITRVEPGKSTVATPRYHPTAVVKSNNAADHSAIVPQSAPTIGQ